MELIFFDLECTCWDKNEFLSREDSEIIEIGAVKFKNGDIIEKFHSYVKPYYHPMLSEFCSNLTNIKQSVILTSDEIGIALNRFDLWIGDADLLISWGEYDKNMIVKEIRNKNIKNDSIIEKLQKKHFNLKNVFMERYNKKHSAGLSKALNFFNLKFQGKQHSALDDSINMVQIFNAMKLNDIIGEENDYKNKITDRI